LKNLFKRMFALLLVLVMIGSLIPAPSVQGATLPEPESNLLTEQDYQTADAVFAEIDQMEEDHAKKNLSETQLADAAATVVMSSDSYVDGSLDRNGNFFTWWTEDGVRCVYSPRMRQIQDEMVAPSVPEASGAYNVPAATKGSTSTEVFLVGPYYGIDNTFTAQYKNEAARIAKAIGDTDGYTLYSGKAATVDTVANAMSKGAVVIFDSHGDTDYINPNDEYDYVTGAKNSYLCLTSTTGLTDADYADGALYYSDGICINGATIANHMTSQNPGGILWMAICLGMATDTMCQPMRDMGVEVVYGYSQSVTFDGDYLYEECFWDNMCNGTTVAAAIADMKEKFGCWDMSEQMYDYYGWQEDEYGPFYDLDEARYYTCAFPVVVSDEDTHPGQRNGSSYGADSLQTVKSTYKLNITGTGFAGPDNAGVTEPTAGTAYKLYMDKNGTRLYFNGQTESAEVNFRLATTINKAEAVNVYLENVSGGYRLYFYSGNVKTYIRVYERTDGDPGYGKGSLELVTSAPSEVLSMDKATGTLVYTADDGENAYYMGTYKDYTTFSVSNAYYITGENAGNVDMTQFPARLEQVDGSTVIPTEPKPTDPQPTVPGSESVVKISFADTSSRVSFNAEQQVWKQNGITVTNDKDASSSNVGDYSNPARFYKNSTLTIQYPGMTKIVVDSVAYNDNDYAANLVEAINSAADGNAIAHAVEDDVTILFANPVNSYSVVLTTGQVRAYEMSVYSGFAGEVTPTEPAPSNPKPTEPTPSEPAGATAYKLYMDKNGTKLYFNGQTESAEVNFRLATTTNKAEAVNVYLENVSGGYRLYFYSGNVKTYIRVYERTDGDPGFGKGSLELVTSAPVEVLTVDDLTGTLIYTADDGENAYYMGTYKDFTTFSVSNAHYITGDNAGNVDVSQYPARLEEVAGSAVSVPVITLQPSNQTVLEGETAAFTVKATGDGLKYQWQYRTSDTGSWKSVSASGSKTATVKFYAYAGQNQYQYRCQVTDQYGNVIYSKAATLKVVTLKITMQPANKNVLAGKTAKFTVKAVGEGLKYQWQYRTSNGAWKTASAAGNKTATLSVPATAARNGYQYRCRITDKYGNVISSKAVTLKIVTLKVTSQPANKYLPAGKTAKFTVKVSGTGLKYQWQYRTSAKGNWKTATAAGNKTATLRVPVTAARNGYQYRCQITDQYGNVIYSNAATLKTVTLKITTQPSAVKLAVGKTATFKVVAKGTGLKYQWQFRKNAKGAWKKATNKGNKTATLKVPVTAARNGYQYRCVITDKYGNVINSAAATLKVKK